ncbi:chromate transporter, chromate ion transporter family protein [Acinetobacter sp. 1542444]|uniref:chromate efflux transporter n=1 Tax=Acinetobacter sp. 1542444 TaxID=1310681 RepID=UPI00044E80E1|nr:chromate efflux transporter [Acinetobacter sp. 1542444]EXE63439.1 chromate transporter, chromate ion transporter family protein [Acinetobacter sp. 1542444]
MQQKQQNTPDDSVVQVTFWQAFLFWLKLGFISFGGPAGQIAVMHQELVEQKRWISEKRFLHALNYCMLLPGPEAQQLATYIGWLMHRTAGGLVAGILFVLPSLFILIGLSWVYIKFGDVPVIAGIFYGIKPAVTAIVFHATYRIGSRSLKNKFLWIVAIAAFFAIFVLKLPFPLIVLSAGIAGYLASKKYPELFSSAAGHKASQKDYGPAFIDDETPTPKHAKFHWLRLAKLIFVAIALWLLPILVLGAYFGWHHSYTQMAWFFTKAALLTFGGAYAVLPYVYQGAVNHFGWLSPTQMIDGLALGETTPGPLIMVVAFVGFLGGVNHSLLGSEHLFFAGVLGAVIVTWFTFLFSFVFIFAGAPIIESTHNEIKFTAPLTAITAAVVGVILNLALFFSYHVLWPQGFSGHFDIVAAFITVAAFIALFRFNVNVLYVIFASALVGLAVTFF